MNDVQSLDGLGGFDPADLFYQPESDSSFLDTSRPASDLGEFGSDMFSFQGGGPLPSYSDPDTTSNLFSFGGGPGFDTFDFSSTWSTQAGADRARGGLEVIGGLGEVFGAAAMVGAGIPMLATPAWPVGLGLIGLGTLGGTHGGLTAAHGVEVLARGEDANPYPYSAQLLEGAFDVPLETGTRIDAFGSLLTLPAAGAGLRILTNSTNLGAQVGGWTGAGLLADSAGHNLYFAATGDGQDPFVVDALELTGMPNTAAYYASALGGGVGPAVLAGRAYGLTRPQMIEIPQPDRSTRLAMGYPPGTLPRTLMNEQIEAVKDANKAYESIGRDAQHPYGMNPYGPLSEQDVVNAWSDSYLVQVTGDSKLISGAQLGPFNGYYNNGELWTGGRLPPNDPWYLGGVFAQKVEGVNIRGAGGDATLAAAKYAEMQGAGELLGDTPWTVAQIAYDRLRRTTLPKIDVFDARLITPDLHPYVPFDGAEIVFNTPVDQLPVAMRPWVEGTESLPKDQALATIRERANAEGNHLNHLVGKLPGGINAPNGSIFASYRLPFDPPSWEQRFVFGLRDTYNSFRFLWPGP